MRGIYQGTMRRTEAFQFWYSTNEWRLHFQTEI